MTNVTENRDTLDTLRLLALSRNIPPEIVPVFKRLETGLPFVVSPAEWAAFSEWFDMCEAAGLAPELNQRLLEVRSRIFKAALAPACVVFMPAGVPRVKPAKLPALPAHPVKRKRASAALRYKAGYIAAPRVRIDYTDGSGFSAVRWIDGWMQRGMESQDNQREETCNDALAFDLGSSRRILPQPTPIYEIKLALAFDMCSSCHPLPQPTPACVAKLLARDGSLWKTTKQERQALDPWMRTCLADARLTTWHNILVTSAHRIHHSDETAETAEAAE